MHAPRGSDAEEAAAQREEHGLVHVLSVDRAGTLFAWRDTVLTSEGDAVSGDTSAHIFFACSVTGEIAQSQDRLKPIGHLVERLNQSNPIRFRFVAESLFNPHLAVAAKIRELLAHVEV